MEDDDLIYPLPRPMRQISLYFTDEQLVIIKREAVKRRMNMSSFLEYCVGYVLTHASSDGPVDFPAARRNREWSGPKPWEEAV